MRFHMTEVSMNDEYRLWTHPVVIGSGQRLVREGNDTSGLRLLDRHSFNTEVVVLSYQPARPEDDDASLLFESWLPSKSKSLTDLALAMLGVSPDRERVEPTGDTAPPLA